MNNEPVAWAYIKDDGFFDAIHPDEHDKYEGMYKTPLYTHPAQLTDEEIIKTMVKFDVYSADDQCLIEAGRAILRKAQDGNKN